MTRRDRNRAPKTRRPSPPTNRTKAPPTNRAKTPASPRVAVRDPEREDQLEGRNVVLEALRAGERVKAIFIDQRARPEERLKEIERRARERGVQVTRVPRQRLDEVAESAVHNGVVARARHLPVLSLSMLLDRIFERGEEPFLVIADGLAYEQNLGAILRTCEAAGVHGLIVPTRRGARLTPAAQRVAMGAAEHVPVIRAGIMSVLAELRRAGVRIVAADHDGAQVYTKVRLTGPLALLMGGEHRGVTHTVASRCDAVVRIPMGGRLNSLNVSVAAGLMIFERIRQVQVETEAEAEATASTSGAS